MLKADPGRSIDRIMPLAQLLRTFTIRTRMNADIALVVLLVTAVWLWKRRDRKSS